jgi:hypothetical protein
MSRCLTRRTALLAAALTVALPLAAVSQTTVFRTLPKESLRGELVVLSADAATLNGQPVAIAHNPRIRNDRNRLVRPSALEGVKLQANYTLDNRGELREIWVLNDDELSRPWPKSAEEAAKWVYNPIQRIWIKP